MKMSVRGCADTVTTPVPSSTRQSPSDDGASGDGIPGTINWSAMTRTVQRVPTGNLPPPGGYGPGIDAGRPGIRRTHVLSTGCGRRRDSMAYQLSAVVADV